ncbi:YcaO-like family protein [Paenibacillus sp. FSL H7-0350]|uniref:YcaO-like family protein n=1 Tax=Paenibacillus sp. FSL H7-0350 TaxID=2975345 RepID=UPI0031595690
MLHSAPFIIKSLKIYQSSFPNRPKECTINSFLNPEINGFSRKQDVRNLIKASLGEFQERLAGLKCLKKSNGDSTATFKAFNLFSGDTISVPADFIILNHHQPLFKDNVSTNFTDSSGTAAHLRSDFAIEKGYLEFIERQSLVHSWLSQNPGRRISSDHIESIIKKINSTVEHISFHNISITKDIFVILTLGYGEKAFSVGLGSSWSLEEAIKSSFDEFIMIYDGVINFKINNGEYNTENLYINLFYSKDVRDFIKDYTYLIENLKYENLDEIDERDIYSENKQILLRESISTLRENLNIEVYVTQVPSPFYKNQSKIVKVFSPDAFPHINTSLYDPHDYKISKKLAIQEFPNLYKMIPFA